MAGYKERRGNKKMIAILPWGACEQHGPLLPITTDTIIAMHIAKQVAERLSDSLVLEPLSYGVSTEHEGFEGTISMEYKTAIMILEDVFQSIIKNNKEVDLVIIINGHGGNEEVASLVCKSFNYKYKSTKFITLHVFPDKTKELAAKLFGAFSAHADSVESSVIAAITGNMEDKIYDLTELNGKTSLPHIMKLYPVSESSKDCGIVSKTNFVEVSMNKGEQIIESSIDNILQELQAYQKTIYHMNNVYLSENS